MPDQVTELVKRGRELPPADRERLVDELLESLNEPAASELDSAWNSEIEARMAQFDRGEVQAIAAEEVFAKAVRRNMYRSTRTCAACWFPDFQSFNNSAFEPSSIAIDGT